MKRDMNLVRQILLELEKVDTYDDPIQKLLPDESSDVVNYHVLLMKEGGLIESIPSPKTFDFPAQYFPTRLTWEGHEFLDASRDDTIWKSALKKLEATGESFTFDVIKALLVFSIKNSLGI